jgi:hypothetical protein
MGHEFTIFAGTANPALAAAIACELGVDVGACTVDRFPDGEVAVEIREPVRRKEVFLVQPMAPPVNDNLVELLALADACRRAAAACITAIVPYLAYTRSDKRHGWREPITARGRSASRQRVRRHGAPLHDPQPARQTILIWHTFSSCRPNPAIVGPHLFDGFRERS